MFKHITREVEKLADDLGVDRKRSIGEVAKELKIKTHVIRFWEENFPQIRPEIGAGKRRYYYNKQLKILRNIKKFLHEDGYTIAGLQKMLRKKKTHTDDEIEFDLDDFIESENIAASEILENTQPIKTGSVIDPHARFLDFSSIKVSAIDIVVKKEIEQKISNIRRNLNEIKSLKII